MDKTTEKLPEKGKVSMGNDSNHARTSRRWTWAIFLLMQTMLMAILFGGAWVIHSEKGLRFALLQLPEWFGVKTQATQVQGTIWKGFSVNDFQIETQSAHIQLSQLNLNWQAKDLWHRHLQIDELWLGNIHVQTKDTPPKEKQAMTMPESLSLPFNVVLKHFHIGSFQYNESLLFNQLDGSYQFDKKEHHLKIASFNTPWSDSVGKMTIASQSPFQLAGQLQSSGELDDIAIKNNLELTGSLAAIQLNTHLSGNGIGLVADVLMNPFAPSLDDKIGRITIDGQGINPQAFIGTLPKAKLNFNASVLPVSGKNLALNGEIELHNEHVLSIENGGLPIKHLIGHFKIDEQGNVHSERLRTQLIKDGELVLSGHFDSLKNNLNLLLNINGLTSSDISSTHIAGTLNGQLMMKGTISEPHIIWKLNTASANSEGLVKLSTDTTKGQRTVLLEKGFIAAQQGGKLDFSGSLELFQNQKMTFTAQTEQLNPQVMHKELPKGQINGHFKLTGELAKHVIDAQLQFKPSVLSGVPLLGDGRVVYQNNHLHQLDTNIKLGSNHIHTKGSLGKKGDALKLDIYLLQLQQLGLGLNGLLTAKGSLANTTDGWSNLESHLTGEVQNLIIPHIARIQELNFTSQISSNPQLPLNVQAHGQSIEIQNFMMNHLDASLKGTLNQHQMKISTAMNVDGKSLKLNTDATGGVKETTWKGTINTFNLDGDVAVHLRQPVQLEANQENVVLGGAHWQFLGGQLNLEQLTWNKNKGLVSKGRAERINLVMLNAFYASPVEHDLIVGADWDLSYGTLPRGYLNLRQQGGDIQLVVRQNPRRIQSLELKDFILSSTFDQNGIHNRVSGRTRYGNLNGIVNVKQAFGGHLLTAPLSGQINLQTVELQNLRSLLPLGNVIRGQLNADVILGGTVAMPHLDGNITGQQLYYRNHDIGVILSNGSLSSRLRGQKWIIDSLTFQNGGTVTLSGEVDLKDTSNPNINTKIVFDRYLILNQPGRRLSVSGVGHTHYHVQGLNIDGNLKVEEGRFGRQAGTMPTLNEDVVVLGEEKVKTESTLPITMNLGLDLNDKVMFNWQGLDVALGGKLQLNLYPSSTIQAIGSVHVNKGQYKAYGQNLIINKGIISFVGPLDNPNLNIRAERKGSPVGAGVEVLGNLGSPRISLVADEPMSEKDKLSWLVLNRASSGSSGDEATLATAASAFLAGKLNDRIGLLDDFGLTSSQSRNAQTGEMNPAQQVLTFGKQLTQNLYVGYEVGLATASQSVKFIYQLSRSFQAIVRAGTESSGGEVKYTKRFD